MRSGSLGPAMLACAGLIDSCGSPPSPSPGPSSAVTGTCDEVSAGLSDGPDPGADPVGYAHAQILPLRRIKASDKSLQSAIDNQAYERVSSSNGPALAGKAADRASNRLNALCPGAAS
jgi:hypothetical protein